MHLPLEMGGGGGGGQNISRVMHIILLLFQKKKIIIIIIIIITNYVLHQFVTNSEFTSTQILLFFHGEATLKPSISRVPYSCTEI